MCFLHKNNVSVFLDIYFWRVALFCEMFSPLAFKDISFNGVVKQLV